MTKLRIYLGADHAGFALKEKLKTWLTAGRDTSRPYNNGRSAMAGRPYAIIDLSPRFRAGDDYPKHGFAVARRVAKTPGSRGVLVCGSGVGVAIAANRVKGARTFDAYDERAVKHAREHNDANVIALSGWHTPLSKAKKLVGIFLKTKFSSAARHHRRVRQLG